MLAIGSLFISQHTSAQGQRINRRIDDSETFMLPGNTRPAVEQGLAQDQGPLRLEQKMPRLSLHFTKTAEQRADLTQLLAAQQNRRSPHYHKFLTPEQYAVRFGLHPADIAKVSAWLDQSGFTDLRVARGGTWISFEGTPAKAEAAFHVSLRQYSLHGETHFANAEDPQLPKALAGIVESVRGLHNFSLRSFRKTADARRPHPQFTASSGGNYLAPDDWATIYDLQPLYGAGIDGTGVTIAVVGQSDVQLSDLRAFRAAAGLPAEDPTVVIPTGSVDPGLQNAKGDEGESDLDLEWAGGIAKNANILFVTASATHGHGVDDSIAYVVDNNSAPILSISYGECEANEPSGYITTEDAIFQQASAEGITVLVASGDAGATLCDAFIKEQYATKGLAVDYPASSQYVTGVGGTAFQPFYGSYWSATNNGHGGSALSYIPELAWNDGFQAATGGGASNVFTKPTWQTGTGVPADNARDVPDVSFAASADLIGYLVCSAGSCTNGFYNSANNLDVVGGTSASTPSFAGLLALVIQQGGGNRLGNINTNLYSLAQISTNAFHDITSGSNMQNCLSGTPACPNGELGYYTGPGYDQATGLGSVDGYNFAQQWFGDFTLSPSVNTLTIQKGTSGTATVSIVPQNNFSGPVTFTCSVAGTLVDVTCSVPSGTVSGAGGSATVTIIAATTAKTPWWKRLPHIPVPPPLNRNWLLALTLILLATATLYGLRKQRPLYAYSLVSLVAIAAGAVSCGGGGSSATPAPSPGPLVLTCNLPNAMAGLSYSGSCSASGGTAPYTYSISSGNLPAGITLNASTGALSGTSTVLSDYILNFSVDDSGNPVQHANLPNQNLIVVPPTLTLTCQLPAAVTGVAYNGACTGSGGTTPLHYDIYSGSLPAGLTIDASSGSITGTPQTPGASTFVVEVYDSTKDAPQNVQFTVSSFVVSAGPFGLSCSLPSGATGGYYSGMCSSTGGTPPVNFSISAGNLPAGLTMTSGGIFGGSPTVMGTSAFTVTAADSGTPPQVAQINETVSIATGPLVLSCGFYLPKVAMAFSDAGCHAYGGTQPYTYSISSGALPAGLTINSSTGGISGIPTTAGTASFTVEVVDSGSPAQTATHAENGLIVLPTDPLTLTCGNLPSANLGASYFGACPTTGGNSPYTVSVISGAVPSWLTISVYDNFVQFYGTPTAMGSSTVTIKVTDGSSPPMSATAQGTITVGPRLPETGLVTITATSGGITNTTTITVTVP